jgi:hypothetical protein
MPETDEQYNARQNFEVQRDVILGILGVLDVDQPFVEAIQTVPTLGAGEIPKANPREVCGATLETSGPTLTCVLDAGHDPFYPERLNHVSPEGFTFNTDAEANR